MSGYSFEKHERYCTVQFTPELLDLEWNDLQQATERVTKLVHDAESQSVLVDLTQLKTMPSGVVASLVQTWKGMDEHKRQFVVVTADEHVVTELHQTGLANLWTITDSRDAAYAKLGVRNPTADAGNTNPAGTVTESEGFEFEEFKRYCVITFHPALNSMDWTRVNEGIANVIQRLKASDRVNLMVDLSQMKYIDSGLIASLVQMWKATQSSHGQFALVNSNETIDGVLKVSGLGKLWNIVETRDEAAYDLGVSTAAKREHRDRRLLSLVAVCCAGVSVLATGLMMVRGTALGGVNAQLTALLLAAAALATGVVSIFRDTGIRRKLSIASVVAAVLVLSSLWFGKNPISFFRDDTPQSQGEIIIETKRTTFGGHSAVVQQPEGEPGIIAEHGTQPPADDSNAKEPELPQP